MNKDYTNGSINQFPQLTIFCDGGCEPKNPGGIAVAAWAIFDTKLLAEGASVVQNGGPLATNNYAEYHSLLLPLQWLNSHQWKGKLHFKMDSKLVVSQVLNEWKCNYEHLKSLRQQIWNLLENQEYTLEWIPRDQNDYVDQLGRKAREDYLRNQ